MTMTVFLRMLAEVLVICQALFTNTMSCPCWFSHSTLTARFLSMLWSQWPCWHFKQGFAFTIWLECFVTTPCRWQSWPRLPHRRRGWTPSPPGRKCWWRWSQCWCSIHRDIYWVSQYQYYHSDSGACLGYNAPHTQGEDELKKSSIKHHRSHSHEEWKTAESYLSEKNHARDNGNVSPDAAHLGYR